MDISVFLQKAVEALLSPTGTVATLIISFLCAFIQFSRGTRVSAAELVMELEDKYVEKPDDKSLSIRELVLNLESHDYYKSKWEPVLSKINNEKTLSLDEMKVVRDIDRVLRFWLKCAHLRRLAIDATLIDKLHGWYLNYFLAEKPPVRGGKPEGGEAMQASDSELIKYVRTYWPTVWLWAQIAGQPFPKAMLIQIENVGSRLCRWWNGPRYRPNGNERDAGAGTSQALSADREG